MRKKKENKRIHERGDGIRRRYYDALDPDRFRFPRDGLVHHTRAWYLSDAPLARPVFGLYALGAFAEDALRRARTGRPGTRPDVVASVRLFAFTRRALQNVLSSYRIDRRLTPKEIASVRRLAAKVRDAVKGLIFSEEGRTRPPRSQATAWRR